MSIIVMPVQSAQQPLKVEGLMLQSDLCYPRFLRPNLSMPNLYELQSDLYDSHLYYPRTSFIRGFETKI